MGCRKSTKRFFLRVFCCEHGGRGRARPVSIGHPTNFRKEDPYNSGLSPDLLALIQEKAAADAHHMVKEPLLKETNTSHEVHDNTVNSRPSLRGRVKEQTRRLSLALYVGGNNASGAQGNLGTAGGGSNGSQFYSCNDFADSAHAGILRCGREDDEERSEAEAEVGTATVMVTGNTSAATSDFHGSKDSIMLH